MTRTPSRLAVAFVIALAPLVARSAPVVPKPTAVAPQPTTVSQAQAHFRMGTAHFRVGSYDLAIEEFEAAWKLDPRPLLLFNIAQCHRQMGHREAAIDHYRRFLDLAPDDPVSDEAREHFALLIKEKRDADAKLAATGGASATASGGPGPSSHKSATTPPFKPAGAVPPHRASPSVARDPASARRQELLWSGVGLMAGGVAVGLAGGIGFGVAANDKAQAVAAQAANYQPFDPSLDASRGLMQGLFIGSIAVGAAAAVTGAVLTWLGAAPGSDGHRLPIQVQPAVSSREAGLLIAGGF